MARTKVDNGGGSGTVTQVDTAGLITGGPIVGTGTITTSMNPNRLVGRNTGGVAGIMEEITPSTRLEMVGTNLNWIPTTYVVRNVTGTIDVIEEYTVCTAATGVELTLPTAAVLADENPRHTIINRDTSATLKISATGGDGFGNKDVTGNVFIGPGEAMTFIADGVNTWLYQQDRTMYDRVAPTVTAVANLNSANIEVMYVWRVGNEVCFRGVVTTDPIANNTQSIFRFTVPLYDGANFIATADAGVVGVGTLTTAIAHSMSGQALVATNQIECSYFETHGAADDIIFTGSYRWIA